jgi:unsaturated rhamnogalacturonyl hydrolase
LSVLCRQAVTLKKHQNKSGLWHTLIDDPGSYLEASATAGFAYGLMKAVRKHYLGPDYAETAVRAMKGVVDNIDEDGELKQVSTGTPMGHDLEFYRQIRLTPMPYGQSMAILCLTELLRSYM